MTVFQYGNKRTHGMSRDPARQKEYRAWVHMRERCFNPEHPQYADYGGRGIDVCKAWEDFGQFYRDMGPAPPGLSLDRIRNGEGYRPDNCRWATRSQQNTNRDPYIHTRPKADKAAHRVPALVAQGYSSRRIAAELGIGKSLAHKLMEQCRG